MTKKPKKKPAPKTDSNDGAGKQKAGEPSSLADSIKSDRAFAEAISSAPLCYGPDEARRALQDFLSELPKTHSLHKLAGKPAVRNLLLALADHSPYLWSLATKSRDRLSRLLTESPESFLDTCLNSARKSVAEAASDDDVMRSLRVMKQDAHLIIAMADLAGVWAVDRVIAALSEMADCAVRLAIQYLLRNAAAGEKLKLNNLQDPENGCGMVVLALGKHGAGELNYSSDVDLIVFFDAQSPAVPDPDDAPTLFVRITRQLVKLLQERTEDGYVLRVDLRLRPDPGSTSVAISLPAAFDYYESVGQNWERAAYIKARPVAGDIELGERFIADLSPFIWRKYFDFAAIADVHAMKRQIHAVRGHGNITIAGHDIKLGRGGIREIEFFVQTQQLIFGGRRPKLRDRRTLTMLQNLKDDGWIDSDAVRELSESYRLLRKIEHRLQMRIDEQTQRLPSSEAELNSFALFCGYDDRTSFDSELTNYMQRVEHHYAQLFEHAPALSSSIGSLVFTGSSDDPDTLQTLQRLGFADPPRAIETIRGWHFGRRAGVQSARAREVLTDLVPGLIESFSGSGDPDAALAAFDEALAHMPASIELLSILKSNQAVRELFGDILGGAPRLAHVVTQRPHVLDAAIDPALLGHQRDETYFETRAARILLLEDDTERVLDAMRDMALEESFLIGVRTLSGAINAAEAGWQYSVLATCLIRTALAHIESVFKHEYGLLLDGGCTILGLGKLGSMEMTATSDLDLILIYQFNEDAPQSDGPRSIHANQYYARLTQRLVSALTVPTRRGPLYEVDMRLRPSGRQGPVATSIQSFEDYQRSEAETWELMAMTRARVVAGNEKVGDRAKAAIKAAIVQDRNAIDLQRSVRDMRKLIAGEKGEVNPWDFKLMSGGLIDIEFISQYLTLRYAKNYPDIYAPKTQSVLEKAISLALMNEEDAKTLIAAHGFYSAIMQTLRLALDGEFNPGSSASGVLRRIALAVQLPDFRTVTREVANYRQQVRKIFNTMMS